MKGAHLCVMLGNAAVPMAAAERIDETPTGHHYSVCQGPQHEGAPGVDTSTGTRIGKPAVMAGFWGRRMGLEDLVLERDGNSWRMPSHQSEARPICLRNEDSSITAFVESCNAVLFASVAAEHEATLAYVRRAVRQTSAPLHSYFALVGAEHEGLRVWAMPIRLRPSPSSP